MGNRVLYRNNCPLCAESELNPSVFICSLTTRAQRSVSPWHPELFDYTGTWCCESWEWKDVAESQVGRDYRGVV